MSKILEKNEEESKLGSFESHGVVFNGRVGNQVKADCIFCGGDTKFYVNSQNYCWDCKKCGLKGNLYTFLHLVTKRNLQYRDHSYLNELISDRKLPLEAFLPWEVGFDGKYYTFPIRGEQGKLTDVRRFKIGGRILGTKGCQTGLLGLDRLLDSPINTHVYICEGEWDTMAMHWLVTTLKIPCVVVGSPGAGTFKNEWVKYFESRDVSVLYDNDAAGRSGELTVQKKLNSVVNSMKFIHWADGLPDGYDIRDIVVEMALTLSKPKTCFKRITSYLHPETRIGDPSGALNPAKESMDTVASRHVTLQDLFTEFKKHLYLTSTDPIEVSMATVLSTEIQGDPLWVFLVGSSGGGKTEFVNAFRKFCKAHTTSSLTPQSLISGMGFKEGKDPSLIPRLDGKTLIIKDFTSVTCKRDTDKDEIFGALRDAYDGYCSKIFGTGERRYESHFSILSGVTQDVYLIAEQYQSLGERFIKFGISNNSNHDFHEEIIDSAISNIGREREVRDGIADATKDFMLRIVKNFNDGGKKLPTLTPEIKSKIIGLAKFGSKMRGTVHRDKRQSDLITSKPHEEFGTRLGKQITKMAYSLALINERTEITEHEYQICKKIILDTISQRYEDLVRIMIKQSKSPEDTFEIGDLSSMSRYPVSTVRRMLSDMLMLEIVERYGTVGKSKWKLSKSLTEHIQRAQLYQTKEELERISWMKESIEEPSKLSTLRMMSKIKKSKGLRIVAKIKNPSTSK